MPSAFRYALYFCPPEPWLSWARVWLGRCEASDTLIPQAEARVADWTSAPRHYGVHATLKAPFRLAHGKAPRDLDAATSALAQRLNPFDVSLQREVLRGFMAWTIADEDGKAHMRALADAAVVDLDAFRAPATASELARRDPQNLSEVQRNMLQRWGYPHVFDAFVFHITLTNLLPQEKLRQADELFGQMVGDEGPSRMPVESISVYAQATEGAPFVAARHYGFDGRRTDSVGAGYLA